jgi:hypothetical protein
MVDIESINRNETLVEEFLRFGVVRRDRAPNDERGRRNSKSFGHALAPFVAEYQKARLIAGVLYTSAVLPRDNLPCPVPPFGQIALCAG